MSTTAQLQPESVSVEAGGFVAIPLSVTNSGEVVEDYQVSIVGVPSEWTTVEPSHFTLYPGTAQDATVEIRPPRSSAVPAGEFRFGVHVVPTEHPDQAVVPEAVVELLPYVDMTAEIVPRTTHGRFGGKHHVAIDNRGNVPATVVLTPDVDSDALTVRTVPESVTVEPGMATFGDVHVRTTQRLWRGTPKTLPFALLASTEGGEHEVRLEAGHVQDAVFPPWILKALLGLLALALLLLGVWFLLLRPVIAAAARDAVEEPIKNAEAAAAIAEQAASEAGQAATQAGQAASEAVQSRDEVEAIVNPDGEGTGLIPTTPTVPPLVTGPFADRLTVVTAPGTQRTDTFRFSDGQRMGLTDFVLENTQGDSGVLTLRLGDRVILTQALESFRTTDYHFVTPFVASGPIDLQLVIQCNRPGTPPDTDPAPASCRNAVTFGGELAQPAP